MTNSLRNFTIATLGAVLASLGSIASAAAADLSFSLSGLFEPNPAGLESFSGTFSFDPEELEPAAGILETELSSYSITFFPGIDGPPEVWTSEDFDLTSLVQFPRVDRGTTVFTLDFRRPEERFGLRFLATNLTDAPTEPDFTAAPTQFFGGELISRGFRDPTGEPFSVVVASATITADAQPPAAVPEPGTAVGLSGVALGWLLTRKFASSKSN
jgi:hypothetical protein